MLANKEKNLEIQGKKYLFILIWFQTICKNVNYLPLNIVNKSKIIVARLENNNERQIQLCSSYIEAICYKNHRTYHYKFYLINKNLLN